MSTESEARERHWNKMWSAVTHALNVNERGSAEQTDSCHVVINQSPIAGQIYTQRSELWHGWCTLWCTQKKIKHKDTAYVKFKRLHYSDNNQNMSLSWHKSLHSFCLCPPSCFWCRQLSLISRRTWRNGPIMVECPMLGSIWTRTFFPFSVVMSSLSVPLPWKKPIYVSSIVQLLFPVPFQFVFSSVIVFLLRFFSDLPEPCLLCFCCLPAFVLWISALFS